MVGKCLLRFLLISEKLSVPWFLAKMPSRRKPCRGGRFRCNGGQCIFGRYVCDGYPDCPDGSDEAYELCGYDPCHDRVYCQSTRRCIPVSWCCHQPSSGEGTHNCDIWQRALCCSRSGAGWNSQINEKLRNITMEKFYSTFNEKTFDFGDQQRAITDTTKVDGVSASTAFAVVVFCIFLTLAVLIAVLGVLLKFGAGRGNGRWNLLSCWRSGRQQRRPTIPNANGGRISSAVPNVVVTRREVGGRFQHGRCDDHSAVPTTGTSRRPPTPALNRREISSTASDTAVVTRFIGFGGPFDHRRCQSAIPGTETGGRPPTPAINRREIPATAADTALGTRFVELGGPFDRRRCQFAIPGTETGGRPVMTVLLPPVPRQSSPPPPYSGTDLPPAYSDVSIDHSGEGNPPSYDVAVGMQKSTGTDNSDGTKI